MPVDDLTLYADWTINEYTITFDSNEGSIVTAITQDYGTSVTKPADPMLDGYTFTGWYTDDGTFLNEYTFGTMPGQNITLYAKWNVVLTDYSYTLNFDSVDITNKPTTTSYVTIGDNDSSNGIWSGRASKQTVATYVGYGQRSGDYLTYTAASGYYVYSVSISFNSTGTTYRAVLIGSQTIVSGTGANTVYTSEAPVVLNESPTSFTLSVNTGTNNVISVVLVCKPINP